MASRRLERAQDLVRQEVSRLLLFKAKDPRLKAVTVTGVRMTGDLKRALVLYSLFDDKLDRKEIQTCLEKAGGFLRREVGRTLELKFTPELKFEFDPSMEYAQHMEKVFNDLNLSPEKDEDDDSST